MRKISMFCLVVLVNIFVLSTVVAADQEVTVSEKLWTVELSLPVSSEDSNLNKIKVRDAAGQDVQINVEVDRYNAKILEVSATTGFEEGNYDLIIPAGFISKTGEVTSEEYVKNFTVQGPLTHAHLNDEWSTNYKYLGILYGIKVKFDHGNAHLVIQDLANGVEYTGTETYELKNGNMLMYVDDLRLSLDGSIRYYNEDLFKIVTAGGKYTYFKK